MRPARLIAAVTTTAVVLGSVTLATLTAPPASAAAAPTLSVGPDQVVGEADGSVTVPVFLSAPAATDVTVTYQTVNDTADGSYGYDYTGTSGTLDFSPGQTEQTVSIALKDDTTAERTESFRFTLTGTPTGAGVARAVARVSIVDNDTVVATPDVYPSDLVVDETAGTVQVPVTLGREHGERSTSPATVAYSVRSLPGDTATAGSDYVAATGTLTFAPGQSVRTVPVTIRDDATSEHAERFHVVLSDPVGAELAHTASTVTIGANDQPTVPAPRVSVGPDTVVAEDDAWVDLPVTLSAPSPNPVTVAFTTANTTADGSYGYDYRGISGTLVFTPGQTLRTVRVELTDDTTAERTESFALTLTGTPTNASIARSWNRVSIVDDDTVVTTPDLYATDLAVDESAGTVSVPVTLGAEHGQSSHSPVTVRYAVESLPGDTAKAGADYVAATGTLTFAPGETVQDVPVDVTDDTAAEGAETFHVVLSDPVGGEIADPTGIVTIGANDQAAVPAPTVSLGPDRAVGEADGWLDLPVTLSAPGRNPVTVKLTTVSGTADGNYGYDFRGVAGTLVFAPGQTLLTVRVELTDDTTAENPETFTAALSAPVQASLGRATTTVTVADDDRPASAAGSSVVVSPSSVPVGGTLGSTVTVTLLDANAHPAADKQVVLYPTGSATSTLWSGVSDGRGVVTFQLVDAVKQAVSVTAYDSTDAVTLTATPKVTFTGPVPGRPAAPTARVSGSRQLTVTWASPSAPADDPVTGYVVTPHLGSTALAARTVGRVTSAVWTGLAKGKAYTFTVAARNAAGVGATSPASAAVTVPATAPGAPTAVRATVGNARATVRWTAPADTGGAPLTRYVVTPHAGKKSLAARTVGTATSVVVTGLTNGTAYTFTVAAGNKAGTGKASSPSASVTPRTVPGRPSAVRGTAGDKRVTLTWKAPATGGSPITGYVVTPYVGTKAQAARTVGKATSATVTGLKDGTAYTFTVTARNAAGKGAASAHSAKVTPVRPTLSISVNHASVKHGATVTVKGTAKPAFTGTVYLQRYTAKGGKHVWVRVKTATLKKGSYSVGLKLSTRGSYTLRVVTKAATGHPVLTSATKKVTAS